LQKFIIHAPQENHGKQKESSRSARHRYERPSVFRADVDKKHHRAHGHKEEIESHQTIYTKVLSDMLQLHNHYRARHSAAPLTVSQRLNHIAQKYADHLAATSKFEHSGNRLENEMLGENLYMQWISFGKVPVNARDAAKSWYDEIDLYSFKRAKYSEDTGHFTQLVWKSTQKMGVGVALSADGREVYIVNQGYFEKNVLPAKH
jgi:uncharacterized protein YkwD